MQTYEKINKDITMYTQNIDFKAANTAERIKERLASENIDLVNRYELIKQAAEKIQQK